MSETEGERQQTPQASNRRMLLAAGAAIALLGVLWAIWSPPPQQAQRPKRAPLIEQVAMDDLMQRSGTKLAELAYGNADAKVTIVEYASMTCKHCATFHTKVFPEIKKKYIDTGKVRFVFREFPLDGLAMYASMLARCAGEGKALPLISALFEKQDTWAVSKGDPLPALQKVWDDQGLAKADFEACRTNRPLAEDLLAIRDRADKRFGVHSTPAFFVNGKRLTERPDIIESFDKALAPLI